MAQLPSSPGDPSPLFAEMKQCCCDESANGVCPPLDVMALCSPHRDPWSHTSSSWFLITDGEMGLHKCLADFLFCLQQTALGFCPSDYSGHDDIPPFSGLSLHARLVYPPASHFSTQLFDSLQLGNTDKHFKKCMLLGHLIDDQPLNSIVPLQVAAAHRQANSSTFSVLVPGSQVTMFK